MWGHPSGLQTRFPTGPDGRKPGGGSEGPSHMLGYNESH